jgi:hypothetical protein
MTRVRLFLMLAAIHVGSVTAAPAQELAYAGSLQFASGSYIFAEPIRTLSLYNGISWSTSRVRFAGSIPVVIHTSGAMTLVGGEYVPTGGAGHGAVGARSAGQPVRMGSGNSNRSLVGATPDSVELPGRYSARIGDPLLSAGLELFGGFGRVRSLEVTAGVKPPLNDLESGIGTGDWDVGAGVATVLGIGRILALIDIMYWRYGDLPELELRDGVSWAGGLAFPLTRALSATVLAAGTNRIIVTADPALTVSLGMTYRVSESGSGSVSAGGGLSDSAADVVAALGWRRILR